MGGLVSLVLDPDALVETRTKRPNVICGVWWGREKHCVRRFVFLARIAIINAAGSSKVIAIGTCRTRYVLKGEREIE